MQSVDIFPNMDETPWTDLTPEQHVGSPCINEGLRVGLLPNGTVAGNPTVEIFVPLPSGQHVIVEFTLDMFLTVADAMRGAGEAVGWKRRQ